MSPILLNRMIDKIKIAELVNGKLEENMFLVDISVSTNNVIHVEIDSFTGLTIDQCVAISRHIESNLDRETEDFELQVSSPGAGQPFKVREQYRKNAGRELEVTLTGGKVLRGILMEAGEAGFVIEYQVKEKAEGSSKRVLVSKKQQVSFEEVERARVIISFK